MRFLPGLRQRVTAGVLVYVVLVSAVVVAHGYMVNEQAEHIVWQSLLESELKHFMDRHESSEAYQWTDTETLNLYGSITGKSIPREFADLSPGVHDEVASGGKLFVALISQVDGEAVVLTLDISDVERNERQLALTMAAWTAAAVAILAFFTHLGAGWLVRPLSSMANNISSWLPDRSGQRIDAGPAAPREAEIIARALNQYAGRLEQFLERERAFINVASHELRTPIAVISGSAEIALGIEGTSAETKRHLRHVLTTGREMERLLSLLVALAKDPERLRAASEPVDLGELLPSVSRDHEHLATSKELSFEVVVSDAPLIEAPPQIARAAIGNLIRNAVENSDRGIITVTAAKPARVIISDPGHGMSEKEMSLVYTRLARSGELGNAGIGIGIDLITRLCEHLGWRLNLVSRPNRGTTAILDFWAAEPQARERTFFRQRAS